MNKKKFKWNQYSFNTWYALVYFIDGNMFRIERRGHRGQYEYTLFYLHPSWTITSAGAGWKHYAPYPSLELAKGAAQTAYDEFVAKVIKDNGSHGG
ncbi:MAG: hypothetical protein WC976_06195 [Caldisericia bacterium]